MNNMKIWNALKRPPEEALKTIRGGRLSGMTDIKPQWRYEAMTDHFGACGTGWKYIIERLWIEEGNGDVRVANAEIILYYLKSGTDWSDGIPGVGGSMLVASESKGPHTSDEAYKMAITDAIGTAMKMLGVAADIYSGLWDGTKYKEPAHRFKKGEKEKILEGVKSCLQNGDEEGLQEIFSEYTGPDERMKIWAIFSSSERAAIKELMK